MENVKVIIWGLDAMGSGVARTLLRKKGVDIVGAIDIGNKVGKSLFELLDEDFSDKNDIKVGTTEDYIKEEAADVVILCTDSFVEKSYDKMKLCIKNKMNVISSAEEMAYPKAQNPELTEKLDNLAKENKVSVLGTGINPGLIMDVLALVMTGACVDINHITTKRINSLSPFGKAVMEEQGIGITVEEFEEGKRSGELSGHVGFPESLSMIADALGVELSEITQDMDPIVTDVDRQAPNGFAKAGDVAGVSMTASGLVNNKEFIRMEHPQQMPVKHAVESLQ